MGRGGVITFLLVRSSWIIFIDVTGVPTLGVGWGVSGGGWVGGWGGCDNVLASAFLMEHLH